MASMPLPSMAATIATTPPPVPPPPLLDPYKLARPMSESTGVGQVLEAPVDPWHHLDREMRNHDVLKV